MRRISNTAELETELRHLLDYAQSAHPSRTRLAAHLDELSSRIGGFMDEIDPRACVSQAAKSVKNPEARQWLLHDERGTWEKEARRLIEWLRQRNPDVLVNDPKRVIKDVATQLGYQALEAILSAEKKKRRLATQGQRVAGHSFGIGELSVVFTQGRKLVPFNIDAIREINRSWFPLESLEGIVTDGNLKFVHSEYSDPLTRYEEQAGLRQEIRVDVEYPTGSDQVQAERLALKELLSIGKRLGFAVRPSQRSYHPQHVQTQWKARPKRVGPFGF